MKDTYIASSVPIELTSEIVSTTLSIGVCKLREGVEIPEYHSSSAAGFDLSAGEDVVVGAGQRVIVPTGLCFEIPEGYEVQIRPRSGFSLKRGFLIANSPGTIDSDYRGEIGIILFNTTSEDQIVIKGERIAQGVLAPVVRADFELVDSLSSTERGIGGFGSTGI